MWAESVMHIHSYASMESIIRNRIDMNQLCNHIHQYPGLTMTHGCLASVGDGSQKFEKLTKTLLVWKMNTKRHWLSDTFKACEVPQDHVGCNPVVLWTERGFK